LNFVLAIPVNDAHRSVQRDGAATSDAQFDSDVPDVYAGQTERAPASWQEEWRRSREGRHLLCNLRRSIAPAAGQLVCHAPRSCHVGKLFAAAPPGGNRLRTIRPASPARVAFPFLPNLLQVPNHPLPEPASGVVRFHLRIVNPSFFEFPSGGERQGIVHSRTGIVSWKSQLSCKIRGRSSMTYSWPIILPGREQESRGPLPARR